MNAIFKDSGGLCSSLIQKSLALTSALSFFAAGLYLLPQPPFGPLFTVCAAISGTLHLGVLLFFSRLESNRPGLKAVAWANFALLAAVVSDTGGAFSPFGLLFIWVVMAGAVCGVTDIWISLGAGAAYLLASMVDIPALLGVAPSVILAPGCAPLAVSVAMGIVFLYVLAAAFGARWFVDGLACRLAAQGAEQERLLKRFSELESSAQIGQLAHRIAHDLRGPVASISGFLELELAEEKRPEQKETLRGLSETVGNMVHTLQGITRFGKPGGHSAETVHLADFMKDLVGIASYSSMARGVEFSITSAGANALCVLASRADLQQAVFNVVKNAVEAVADNADGKKVSIVISRAGGDAQILVTDNGPGMDPAALRSAFRKSGTTKRDGTGVGLLITRDLLARNQGGIKLRNNAGGGLTAEITLPAA